MSDTNREGFNPCTSFGYPFGTKEAIAAVKGYQAAVSASDARYQARIKELEEALRLIQDMVCDEPLIREIALKVELLSTPDTALKRDRLEQRLDELETARDGTHLERRSELRAQLASLNSNETLGE